MRHQILAELETLVRDMASAHAPEFLEVDVTMSQAKVLFMVSIHPGTNMSMVATRLGVGLSAVSGLVDRLVEHGYLTRQEDADDRRQNLLTLSPQGSLVIERIRELNMRHFEGLMAGLSEGELEALLRGISAMAREASAQFEASRGDADLHSERESR
jgi:DNA-binding MarR family transcriptional regulator